MCVIQGDIYLDRGMAAVSLPMFRLRPHVSGLVLGIVSLGVLPVPSISAQDGVRPRSCAGRWVGSFDSQG